MKALGMYMRELFFASPVKFVVNLLLMIVLGMLEGIGILMIIPLLMVAGIVPGMQVGNGLAAWLSELLQKMETSLNLPVVLTIYVGVIFTYSWLQRSQTMLNFNMQQSFNVLLSVRLFKAVAFAEWQLMLARTKSDITHILITELMRVHAGINYFLQIIAMALTTLIHMTLAFFIAPALTCWAVGGAFIVFLFLQSFIKKARRMGQRISRLNRNLLFTLTEHLSGLKDVKSYGMEAVQIRSFSKTRDMLRQNAMRLNTIQTRADMLYKVGAAVFISLFLFSAIEIFKVNPREFIVIAAIAARLWPRVSAMQMNLQNLNSMFPAFRAVKELEIQCFAAQEHMPGDGSVGRMKLEGGVEFRNVSYRYETARSNFAIEGANFMISAGKTTALVGVSGSGKSTLVDLLTGLLIPVEGEILIDGEPLTENLRKWRNSLGYVPQDPFVLNASIRENLLWACPGASAEEIWEALRLASVDTFIGSLPKGLDTIVGDRGICLSGGERQRIVLAKALLRRPSVLILDEATSSLDAENEKRIQQAMENLQGKMTIVVIAHRVSTIRNADRILVLEQGRIIEQGNYRSLMEKEDSRFCALACSYTG